MANKRRVYKVAERIRELIAKELFHLADPRFELVTISSVVINQDLSVAKVYWNVFGDDEKRASVTAAFTSAAGHFRYVIGKDLTLKSTPSLLFHYDDTLDTCEEIDRLMKKAGL